MESNRYFIYAYPHSYGGLHGMYDYAVVNDYSYEAACEYGHELSLDVMDRYGLLDEMYSESDYREEYEVPEDRDIDWDIFYEIQNELAAEEADYEIYLVRPEVSDQTIYSSNDAPKDIIRKYCLPVEN